MPSPAVRSLILDPPVFTPAKLANLVLWHRADALGLVDLDPIPSIADQSGNGSSASQGTGAAQFTYRSGIVNGLPVMRLDGVDDVEDVADSGLLDNAAGMTWFFLFKQDALTATEGVVSKWTYQTDGGWTLQTGASGEMTLYVANAAGDAGTSLADSSGLGLSASAFNAMIVVYDGTLANADRIKFYRNGLAATSVVSGTIPTALRNSGAPVKIGRWGGTLSRFWGGDIQQWGMVQRAISALEVAQLGRYLTRVGGLVYLG